MVKDNKKNEKIDILDELAAQIPLFKDKDYESKVEPIPSGSISLDMAIGIGGYPKGAIIDIFGMESSGKSLISIMAMAQIQKTNGTVVVWDLERSYTKNLAWMRVNGVDTSKVRFLKLPHDKGAELGFDAIEKICKAKAADLIVVDSIPSIIPTITLEKDMTESTKIGARAALLTNALPRLAALTDESKVSIMFINQMRANIGGGLYGPTEKETSIYALKHFSTLRLVVNKINKSIREENGVPVAHRVRIKVVKNKVAAPYRQAEFEINYTSGVNNIMEASEILVSTGIAKKKAAWIEYDGKRMHGISQLTEYLKDKTNYSKAIERIKESKANVFGVMEDEYQSIPTPVIDTELKIEEDI